MREAECSFRALAHLPVSPRFWSAKRTLHVLKWQRLGGDSRHGAPRKRGR